MASLDWNLQRPWQSLERRKFDEVSGSLLDPDFDVLLEYRRHVWAGGLMRFHWDGYAPNLRVAAPSVLSEMTAGLLLWVGKPPVEDSRGNLWAGGRNRLWRWEPGPPETLFLLCVPFSAPSSPTLNETMNGRAF